MPATKVSKQCSPMNASVAMQFYRFSARFALRSACFTSMSFLRVTLRGCPSDSEWSRYPGLVLVSQVQGPLLGCFGVQSESVGAPRPPWPLGPGSTRRGFTRRSGGSASPAERLVRWVEIHSDYRIKTKQRVSRSS